MRECAGPALVRRRDGEDRREDPGVPALDGGRTWGGVAAGLYAALGTPTAAGVGASPSRDSD